MEILNFKPILAVTLEDLNDIVYPCLATPKLDGLRCILKDGLAISRTLKSIPNIYIKTELEHIFKLENHQNFLCDGEVLSGSTFQECSGNIMRQEGEPDFKYYVFDYISEDLSEPYEDRIKKLEALEIKDPRVIKLIPTVINNLVELLEFEKNALAAGFEGVIIRSPKSPYKCGRSTLKEGYLLKLKQFSDSEAEIYGFEELMHNHNVKKKNLLGNSERSSSKANLVGGDTLGTLLVRDIYSKIEFRIGSGFDDTLREEIWTHQTEWLTKIIKYKFFATGVLSRPRFPVFLGERSIEDM